MLKEHQEHIDQATKFAAAARKHGKHNLASAIDAHIAAAHNAAAAHATGDETKQVPATKAIFDSVGSMLSHYEPGMSADLVDEGRNTLRTFYNAGLVALNN